MFFMWDNSPKTAAHLISIIRKQSFAISFQRNSYGQAKRNGANVD